MKNTAEEDSVRNIIQIDGADSASETEDEDESFDNSDNNFGINMDNMTDDKCARFFLTNARSLEPKMGSLLDAFQSLNLHFASVTETWYRGGKDLASHFNDVEGSAGIRVIHKSRDGRLKSRGGGVAFAFDTASCNFKRRQMKHLTRNHEVICAVGRIGKIGRKIVVFTVYVPPDMRAAHFQNMSERLAAEIAAVKLEHKDPGIIVCGDFNHRDVAAAIGEIDDFSPVVTGPTRGNNTIDIIHTNFPTLVVESLVLPPLQASTGAVSDHRCVFAAAKFPEERKFDWIVRWRRTRTKLQEEAFSRELGDWDWTNLREEDCVDRKAAILEEVVGVLTEKHFPFVRVRKRSNESPWITRHIRWLWKKKIRIYKKGGRCDKWWETDRKIQELISNSREAFVEKMLEEGNSGKSFYAATRKLASATPNQQWSVRDVFPGKDASEVCHEVLEYFGGIAGSEGGPVPQVDRVQGGLIPFTPERTEKLLSAAKKTN